MASRKNELRQAISVAAKELEIMAGKSTADGFKQEVFDALKEKVTDLKAQLDRVLDAENVVAQLAAPIPGQERAGGTPLAPSGAHKLYSTIKNFEDRQVGGQLISKVDQAYTVGMWFKAAIFGNTEALEWCKWHGIAVQKAQGEGVDSAGAFLVPEELMANIIVLREKFGVFRQQCQVVPMGSDTLNWPRRTGGLTAFFTGENQAITESQASWDNVVLSAKKLATLSRMSNEIAEDAVISVADWLVGEIAYAFATKEDDCGFNGDSTSTYGGMRGLSFLATDGNHNACKYTAATGHNSFQTLDMTDMTGLMATLPQYALDRAKWYMSQMAFHGTIGRLVSAAGGNRIDTLSGAAQYQFLGFPVVIAQKAPVATTPATSMTTKAMMFFGDLTKAAAMGERRGVTIKRSDHRYFENDQIGILGTERFDINVHDMGDNTNAGPIVAMVAP